MNKVIKSFFDNIKGALNTFKTFPVVIASAVIFTLITMIRNPSDWLNSENLDFLFNCLQLSLGVSMAVGLMLSTFAQAKYNTLKSFIYANVISAFLAVLTFIFLFAFGKVASEFSLYSSNNIAILSSARIMVVILISILFFIYNAGLKNNVSDISKSLLVYLKALGVAFVFGMVIFLGFSGIAGAIEALLYSNMSYSVYSNLGAIALFIAFTIFVGYFPSYKKDEVDPSREYKEAQVAIIDILLQFILVPIILVLTVVLLLWTLKILLTGNWPEFSMVSGIVTSYAFSGIFLSLLVSRNDHKLVSFYKLLYPMASIIIFTFGMWSFIKEIFDNGLKSDSYFFLFIWIIAMVSVILLLIKKERAHTNILFVVALMAVISVLPLVNFKDLPVAMQINRLENLLTDVGILQNDELMSIETEIDVNMRIDITDAVNYLAFEREAKLPDWFDKDYGQNNQFEKIFGFDQIWRDDDSIYRDPNNLYLTSSNSIVDISLYNWAINFDKNRGLDHSVASVEGERGIYEFILNYSDEGIPEFKVSLNNKVISEFDLEPYLIELADIMPFDKSDKMERSNNSLQVSFEVEEISVLITLDEISITKYEDNEGLYYYVNLNTIYVREKN